MDQSEQSDSTDIAIVSPNADITLVVGPDEKQIQVQSIILKETSKPFAAMLSENWKDPDTKVIKLPEDDADAMLQICMALHHRYSHLSTDLPPSTMLDIAIIADKYFLLDTLRCVASRYWLSNEAADPMPHTVKRHGLEGMLKCATAAWMFDEADAFLNFTHSLIFDWSKSYIFSRGTILDIFMDPSLPAALGEKRSRIKEDLLLMPLQDLGNENCTIDCGWAARYIASWLGELQASTFILARTHSISEILDAFVDIADLLADDSNTSVEIKHTGKTCPGNHNWEAWQNEIFEHTKYYRQSSTGLCLFCCKAGVWNPFCEHLTDRPYGERGYFLKLPHPPK